MMNFCAHFGGCVITRSVGSATAAALHTTHRFSALNRKISWCRCSSALSARYSSTCDLRRFAPPAAGAGVVPGRPRVMPSVSSQLVHTSAEHCSKDSTVTVDNRHLDLTAGAAREAVLAVGTVTRIWQASNSVLCFRLCVDRPDFCFRAGQWVDVHIPGVEEVGGFSLCSAPHQFAADGCITLGIKSSEWPPAKWFHQNCAVGDTVQLRVGGDFFLDLEGSPDPVPHLLLVGGGVGVNPLLSMMLHLDNLSSRKPRATLLFSARTEHDLLYRRELDELCSRNCNLKVQYFVTRTPPTRGTTDTSGCHRGRISRQHLTEALGTLTSPAASTSGPTASTSGPTASSSGPAAATRPSSSAPYGVRSSESLGNTIPQNLASETSLPTKEQLKDVKVCICGPPAMINDIEEIVLDLGVSKDHLLYEKWW